MEKLLQWAVNNSDQEELKRNAEAIKRGEYKADPSKFNPEIIEAILGKDDATRMMEAVQCMVDPNDTLENKEIAMDNLELLVEGIDNAKNVNNMGLWTPLIQLLSDKEKVVRTGVAWVCGTTVQNNPEGQSAVRGGTNSLFWLHFDLVCHAHAHSFIFHQFLKHNGLAPLMQLLKSDDAKERGKAQYAISSLLKHCRPAYDEFKAQDGLAVLSNILRQHADDVQTVRKIVFLYNTLMVDYDDLAPQLQKDGLINDLDAIITKYTTDTPDEDITEKALRALHTLVQQTGAEIPSDVKTHIQKAKDTFGADELNLSAEEWSLLLN
ncbi:armadillo-type protein [Gongronella butleri]|nr:armadillo-type protein [Gongronella butleri]